VLRSPANNSALNNQRSPPPNYVAAVGDPVGNAAAAGNQRNANPPNQDLAPLMHQLLNYMQQQQITMHDQHNDLIRAVRGIRPQAQQLPARDEPRNPIIHGVGPNMGRGRGQAVPNPPQPHNNGPRMQHLKSADSKMPQYSGANDIKTPYDFIIELEKYQEVVGYTEQDMVQYVIPLALTGDAYNWYRYEPHFHNWDDFRRRLRAEFQALGYHDELKRELDTRSQGPTESLTSYIRIIRDYYERIGSPVAEITIVNRILQKMHPEYRQALLGKDIRTMVDLKREAHSAQELIKHYKFYRPPPTSGSLEPSLAWKPISQTRDKQMNEIPSAMTMEGGKQAKLHLASVDPYAYHHGGSSPKTVQFKLDDFPQPSTSSNMPRSLPRTPPRNDGVNRPRSATPPPNNKDCFHCGSPGHFKRNCPKLNSPKQNSGNESALSPNRR
jgi:hypothetical protein